MNKKQEALKILEQLDTQISIIENSLLLKESEKYVDENGDEWDDEGNKVSRGQSYGRAYGGGTYNKSPGRYRRTRKDMFTGEDYEVDETPKPSSSDRMIAKIKQSYIDKGKTPQEAERIAKAVARKRRK